MYDFECHYREERWQTSRYFDFIKDFLLAAQIREASDDCEPPPCPTTSYTETTEAYLTGECLLTCASLFFPLFGLNQTSLCCQLLWL